MMDDLHRGFLVKLFVSVADVDKIWSRSEELLAGVLFFHLWHRQLDNESLRLTIQKIKEQADRLEWSSLVQPYTSIQPLRQQITKQASIIAPTIIAPGMIPATNRSEIGRFMRKP